jgi:hypothetical protein
VVLKSEEYVALLRIPMSLSIVVLKSRSLKVFIAATLSDILFNTKRQKSMSLSIVVLKSMSLSVAAIKSMSLYLEELLLSIATYSSLQLHLATYSLIPLY